MRIRRRDGRRIWSHAEPLRTTGISQRVSVTLDADAQDEALDLMEYNASVAHLSDAELNTGPWKAGDPESAEQPRTMKEWDERAERIRLAILTFPGARRVDGRPMMDELRAHAGVPDIKHTERTSVWREAGSPKVTTQTDRWLRAWAKINE